MNKALIDSYLRNLLGVVLALVTTTMANTGSASPLDFGLGEWLTVANGLWAAAVPTLLRYANKKDAAFGLIATAVVTEVTKKIETETVKATSATKPSPATVAATAKKPAAKKAAPKK
jgi:hypothetical protein